MDVHDRDCVALLQSVLPRLGLRWAGFRKPRRQVCRRIQRRMDALGLDLAGYRALLEADPAEWEVLESLCRVTITRFHRDHSVWQALRREVLPGWRSLRAWSAGCASGEEPYTLVLLWMVELGDPGPLEVVATDVDEAVLERARRGCYPAPRDLPPGWARAFHQGTGRDPWCLREPFRRVRFERRDLRDGAPDGTFDLVFCRNLAFTYFDEAGQRDALDVLLGSLRPGGALVTARRERPPADPRLAPWIDGEGLWRRTDASRRPC